MTTTLHNSSSAVSTLSNVRTATIHERSKGQRIGNVQESTLQRNTARLRTRQISTGLMTSQTDMIGFHWRPSTSKAPNKALQRVAGSSKTCHVCDAINQELNLRDRTWQCPNCRTQLDRDRNAAVNIHRVGASTLSGEVVSPPSGG